MQMAFLLEPRNGKRAKLVDIIAYEDVYHDIKKKALKVEKERITKSASLIT
jgi:ribosome maturation protein Sdo1